MSEPCNLARSSGSMCLVASAPNPVEIPYAGVGRRASSSTNARDLAIAVSASPVSPIGAPSRATATICSKVSGPGPTSMTLSPMGVSIPVIEAQITAVGAPPILGSVSDARQSPHESGTGRPAGSGGAEVAGLLGRAAGGRRDRPFPFAAEVQYVPPADRDGRGGLRRLSARGAQVGPGGGGLRDRLRVPAAGAARAAGPAAAAPPGGPLRGDHATRGAARGP